MASTGINGTFNIDVVWHHRKGEVLKIHSYAETIVNMRCHAIIDAAIRDAAITGKRASITITVEMNNDAPTAKGRPRAA
jgi:hypothetical protein